MTDKVERLRAIYAELEKEGFERVGFGAIGGEDYEVFLVSPQFRDSFVLLCDKLSGSEALEVVKTLPPGIVFPTVSFIP